MPIPRDGTHQAADARLHHRLHQELHRDIALFGSEGAANADFTRSFRHGREHDVHDADAADQQRYRGNQHQ